MADASLGKGSQSEGSTSMAKKFMNTAKAVSQKLFMNIDRLLQPFNENAPSSNKDDIR